MGASEIIDLSPASHAEIEALVATVSTRLGRPALSEHKQIGLDTRRTSSTAIISRSEEGHIDGYCQLAVDGEGFACELVVDPSRADASSIAASLLQVARETVAGAGGGVLQFFSLDPAAGALAAEIGLYPERVLLQLRRPLPLEEDLRRPIIDVRAFRPGEDEPAWITLNARAFAAHPDQGSWDLETILEREAQPWFSADGFLLHERDGRLAGACWTKVHTAPEALGEIYVIGVDPAFQGLGLGRGLVVAGLAHLGAIGLPVAMLYVEEDNTAAVGLYRALGFVTATREVVYRGEVTPA